MGMGMGWIGQRWYAMVWNARRAEIGLSSFLLLLFSLYVFLHVYVFFWFWGIWDLRFEIWFEGRGSRGGGGGTGREEWRMGWMDVGGRGGGVLGAGSGGVDGVKRKRGKLEAA